MNYDDNITGFDSILDRTEKGSDTQQISPFDEKSERALIKYQGEISESRKENKPKLFPLILSVLLVVAAFAAVMLIVLSIDTPSVEGTVDTYAESDTEATLTGIFSAPEIYESCAKGVVSIVGQSKSSSFVYTGIVWNEEGAIVTSDAVISEDIVGRLSVICPHGQKLYVSEIRSDRESGVCVLKVAPGIFECAEADAAQSIFTGERVAVIGSPFSPDYYGSIASGEIACIGRSLGESEKTAQALIQTNIPLERISAGSPLFNGNGKLVGMITDEDGGAQEAMSFALPIEAVGRSVEKLLN